MKNIHIKITDHMNDAIDQTLSLYFSFNGIECSKQAMINYLIAEGFKVIQKQYQEKLDTSDAKDDIEQIKMLIEQKEHGENK